MSPEKLFDYLEGKFGAKERAAFEERLATDPQLQRELAIAREMHRRARGSREVIGDSNDPEIPQPAKPLGRRLITAFAALVLLHVTVVIDLPSTRADEFHRSLAPLAPPEYSPPPEPSPSADKRTILQVRVGDFPASPTP